MCGKNVTKFYHFHYTLFFQQLTYVVQLNMARAKGAWDFRISDPVKKPDATDI